MDDALPNRSVGAFASGNPNFIGGRLSRMTMRDPAIAFYVAGALAIVGLQYAGDPDPSDQGALRILAIVALAIATLLLVWRSASNSAVGWTNTLGFFFVGTCVAVARPLNMTPIFYIWPILLSTYYMNPRRMAIDVICFLSSFTIAMTFFAEPGNRLGAYVAVVIIVAACLLVMLLLRAQVNDLLFALNRASRTDALTGLLNRRAFNDHIDHACACLDEAGGDVKVEKTLTIAVLDLDHFKEVNDTYGHGIGDEVLVHVSSVLRSTLRSTDVIARVGGEEFAVLLEDVGIYEAAAVCEKLRRAIEQSPFCENIAPTVSVGYSTGTCRDHVTITRLADAALYEAKETGRNRVVRRMPEPSDTGVKAIGRRTADHVPTLR